MGVHPGPRGGVRGAGRGPTPARVLGRSSDAGAEEACSGAGTSISPVRASANPRCAQSGRRRRSRRPACRGGTRRQRRSPRGPAHRRRLARTKGLRAGAAEAYRWDCERVLPPSRMEHRMTGVRALRWCSSRAAPDPGTSNDGQAYYRAALLCQPLGQRADTQDTDLRTVGKCPVFLTEPITAKEGQILASRKSARSTSRGRVCGRAARHTSAPSGPNAQLVAP